MATEPTTKDPAGALAVREAGLAMQFTPAGGMQIRSFAEALAFGKTMIESGFVPKGFNTPAHVVWAVQSGAELGIGPAGSLRAFYIAPCGRPQLYAEAALGVCVARGVLDPEYRTWTEGTGDAMAGYFEFRRKSWKEPKTVKFAVAEARVAGLGGQNWSASNWAKWPQRMVRARVVAFALHDYFADVLMGVTLEGEADEGEESAPTAAPLARPEPRVGGGPDPLLGMVQDVTAIPVVDPPAEPFPTHAEADAAIAAEEAKADCPHTAIAEKVKKLKVGRSLECLDCGEWIGPDVELKLT